MLCLSFSSQSACLPPSPSLSARRRSVGAELSRLVKRLPDDRKIRGILLLTGCCVCAFFFLSPFFFFFLLQMFFVSLFSVKLSRQHNKCSQSTRADTHRGKLAARMRARVCVHVLIGDGSDFVFSDWWQWGGGRKRSHSLTKTSSPPLIIETGFDCLFGNSFSNRCNDND